MKPIRKTLRKLLAALGYDLSRVSDRRQNEKQDLELYLKLFGKRAVEQRRFYNIGAGSFRHPAWTNVDHSSDWYKAAQGDSVALDWDLLSLEPMPLDDGCAEVVYSSHVVEHITDQAAQNMFNEACRILKQGAVFRVTAPNIDLAYRAYKENDRDCFYWIDSRRAAVAWKDAPGNRPGEEVSIQQAFLWCFASSASTWHADGSPERIDDEELDRVFREKEYTEALDYCVAKCSLEVQKKYPGNHLNWWNDGKVTRMLEIAGFGRIHVSGYGQSFCPVLRNTSKFDNTHPEISFYIEAAKQPAQSANKGL